MSVLKGLSTWKIVTMTVAAVVAVEGAGAATMAGLGIIDAKDGIVSI